MKRLNVRIITSMLAVIILCAFSCIASAETGDIIVKNRALHSPNWSPDGKYIAYGGFLADIFIVDVNTGEIRNLTENIPIFETDYMRSTSYNYHDMVQGKGRPQFTADSKVVYYSQDNSYTVNDPDWHAEYIRKVNIETGEYEDVCTDGYVAQLSKDNRYMIYARDQVYAVLHDFETGESKTFDFNYETRLPNCYGLFATGSIHPDNSHFLISLHTLDHTAQLDEMNDQKKIFKVDIETGATELLPLPEGMNYLRPQYSYDGTKILVTARDYYPEPSTTRDPDTYALYEDAFNEMTLYYFDKKLGTDGFLSVLQEITSYEDYLKRRKNINIWTKVDGYDELMFVESPNYSDPAIQHFKSSAGIYDLKTGKYSTLPSFEHYEIKNPCWSPDGNKVAYILGNENDDANSLVVYDLINGTHKTVVPGYEFPEPTSVAGEAAPAAFAITGNYPNPFNPTTTIEFTLEKAGDVSLDIFNVMGQKIRSLESARMTPGAHSVAWNGHDDTGKQVSSGVYICRMKMGSVMQSKAMLLAK